ncbi:hypothetical protein VF21_06904 [Pseudogymnoascus sp. 05NY08]|nr:hypothetical protein VF21_06904 [Pseudogymnoascus sp. 05NY08]
MSTPVGKVLTPIEGRVVSVPSDEKIDEKIHLDKDATEILKDDDLVIVTDTKSGNDDDSDSGADDAIIVTGADAAKHLLPVRDDLEPALTFRSLFLATILSAFQAVMNQIYYFKPTAITIQGTFIVIIAYFLGKAWAAFLPRGDRYEARWRERGGQGKVPRWISIISFINSGPWNLKEHAICTITATSASNGSIAIIVFAAQDLFYDLPVKASTVVLSTLSIGLFGYGISGIMRPIAVWHVDAVYWSTLPTVKTLQGMHWQEVKDSKPIRFFWYAFAGMFAYEWFPAYIFPFLNSVSIPCLAAMHATGSKAAVLTNLFGGSINNEGLGLFTLSFDWQYITSFQISLPLTLQANAAAGFFVCFLAMIGIYYTDAWGGFLNTDALAIYGNPSITGTFAYAMFMANAAIGALITHCILFWGGDIKRAYKSARKGNYSDRHHEYMTKHYKEAPWWWYIVLLVISFVLGLAIVIKEKDILPVWAYIVSLLLGIAFSPFSIILYSRYGNGIATNNLSKMLAGLMLPGRPVGNMYFNAWSHNVIQNSLNLCNDLKMGEYLKIPPRVMFLTQVYGTILGAFVNYAVMISIVGGNRDLLVNNNGNASWSGATIQGYNTNATSWAMAKYLYKSGARYSNATSWAMAKYLYKSGARYLSVWQLALVLSLSTVLLYIIRGFSLSDFNFPQFIQYAGYICSGPTMN